MLLAPQLAAPKVGLGEMVNTARLQPLENRIAIPRIKDPGELTRIGRAEGPDRAEAEERGYHCESQVLASVDEIVDRRPHAVAWPTLASRRTRVRKSPLHQPWVAGHEAALSSRHRVAVVGRDLLGVEIVVAPAVGPAHVVEQQERQFGAGGPPSDCRKLVADRVVVVVAVDDHDVGQRDLEECVEAALANQLERRRCVIELCQRLLRRGIDREHGRPAARRPVDEDPGQIARERADLGHRPRADRIQAGDDQL